MQKLFDASVDYPLVLLAANEEFPSPAQVQAHDGEPGEAAGWSAYEIWHSRIRLLPGVITLFQPHS